jgi:hypothetical protein
VIDRTERSVEGKKEMGGNNRIQQIIPSRLYDLRAYLAAPESSSSHKGGSIIMSHMNAVEESKKEIGSVVW